MVIQCTPPNSEPALLDPPAPTDRIAGPARAERRLRTKAPSLFRQAAHRTTPAKQLETPITAIMNARIFRPRLRQLTAEIAGIVSVGS